MNGSCPLCRKRVTDESGETAERTGSNEALMDPATSSQTQQPPGIQLNQNPMNPNR